MIQVAVEHGPEGIVIHTAVIAALAAQDLRRHVVHGALLGVHGLRGAVHLSRDAEIAEDVGAVLVDEDVPGFDVAVDDVLFLTGGEGVADVAADLHDFLRREGLPALEPGPRAVLEIVQQRHADVNGESEAVRIPLEVVVLDADDVGAVFEGQEELDLLGDALGRLVVVGGDRPVVHAAVAQLLHLGGVLRDADHFQRADGLHAEVVAADLVYLSEAACAEQVLSLVFDVPVRPEWKLCHWLDPLSWCT